MVRCDRLEFSGSVEKFSAAAALGQSEYPINIVMKARRVRAAGDGDLQWTRLQSASEIRVEIAVLTNDGIARDPGTMCAAPALLLLDPQL